ncbi:MAG TPA: hypothetical protein VEH77_18090 [Roseiarcus sp.]|nr:hypothetical protein [Roseiarcus sp.]
MRCYFVKDARIVAVEELPGLSIREAVASARGSFEASASSYDGIEVWSLTRRIYKQDRVSAAQETETRTGWSPAIADRLSLMWF